MNDAIGRSPLTDQEGEVRELTREDIKLFRPIAEVDPGMVEAMQRIAGRRITSPHCSPLEAGSPGRPVGASFVRPRAMPCRRPARSSSRYEARVVEGHELILAIRIRQPEA